MDNLGSEAYLYCEPVMTADKPGLHPGQPGGGEGGQARAGGGGHLVQVRPRPGEAVSFHPENEVNLEYL